MKCSNTEIDFYEYEDSNIWKHFDGILEKTLLANGKHLFICNLCNWSAYTFFEFIPELKRNKNVIIDNYNTEV